MTRFPERLTREFATIAAIFDEALIAHVATMTDRGPLALPTIHARVGDALYIHGSVLAEWMRASNAARVCVTATLVDDLILARSAYQHTMNYRSAVAMGVAETVDDADEKLAALRAIVEHVCPGRWDDARRPTEGELRTTLVLRIGFDDAVAKTRSGPPIDFEADLALDVWSGTVPIVARRGTPVPDPTLRPGVALPSYLRHRP